MARTRSREKTAAVLPKAFFENRNMVMANKILVPRTRIFKLIIVEIFNASFKRKTRKENPIGILSL